VVDEYALTDTRPRMNLDARKHPAKMRHRAPGEEPAMLPQPTGEPVEEERLKPGVAQHHFEARPGGGIAGKSCVYFVSKVFQKHRYHYVC